MTWTLRRYLMGCTAMYPADGMSPLQRRFEGQRKMCDAALEYMEQFR